MSLDRREFIKSCFGISVAIAGVTLPIAVAALVKKLEPAVPDVYPFSPESIICWLHIKSKDYEGYIPLTKPIATYRSGSQFVMTFAKMDWVYPNAEVTVQGWQQQGPGNKFYLTSGDTLNVTYTITINS